MKLSKIRMLYKAAEAGANDDYVHEKLYENGDFHADEVEAKLKDEELDDLDREAIRKAYQCGFYYGNSREAVRQCVADVLGKKDKKEKSKDLVPDLLRALEKMMHCADCVISAHDSGASSLERVISKLSEATSHAEKAITKARGEK